MKNKTAIVITITSLTVIGILYLAFKNSAKKDTNSPELKKDFELLMKKIDNAKK